jgi:hypothetical protein
MLRFSLLPENVLKMDFDTIVMDVALWESFGYDIPEDKFLLDRRGKPKKDPKSNVAESSKQKTPEMALAKWAPTKKVGAKKMTSTPKEDAPSAGLSSMRYSVRTLMVCA